MVGFTRDKVILVQNNIRWFIAVGSVFQMSTRLLSFIRDEQTATINPGVGW